MRGHLRQRIKGSWEIAIDIGKDPATGKRLQHFETIKGKKGIAEKKLTELLRLLDTDSLVTSKRITLSEYLSKWLADYAKPKLSPRSYERYEDIIERYINPKLGRLPLTSLKPVQLQDLYSGWLNKGLGNRTVKYHHAVVHNALRCAVKWGLTGRNVADAVETPKARQIEMKTWTEDEVTRFLEIAKDSRYYVVFYLAMFTGMRRSELLALRWQDVDLLMGEIQVSRGLQQLKDSRLIFTQPKSVKSRRTIALPPSAIKVLREYHSQQNIDKALADIQLTDTDLVFSNYDGSPIRPNTITRAWATLVDKSGLKSIRFHDCRHTHASLMLKQGIHPKIVQERLGHSSITMTLDTYSHVTPGLQEAAAKSFDAMFTGKKTEPLANRWQNEIMSNANDVN